MTTMASQITSLTVVYSTFYSDADQRKHQSSASRAFVWGIHRDRWILRTKGQLRGKCFHLMTSSWFAKSSGKTSYRLMNTSSMPVPILPQIIRMLTSSLTFISLKCLDISRNFEWHHLARSSGDRRTIWIMKSSWPAKFGRKLVSSCIHHVSSCIHHYACWWPGTVRY